MVIGHILGERECSFMTTAAANVADIEKRTVHKVTRRLIPFLFLCFAISILDRVNIGFAALQMNADLGFSSAVSWFPGASYPV